MCSLYIFFAYLIYAQILLHAIITLAPTKGKASNLSLGVFLLSEQPRISVRLLNAGRLRNTKTPSARGVGGLCFFGGKLYYTRFFILYNSNLPFYLFTVNSSAIHFFLYSGSILPQVYPLAVAVGGYTSIVSPSDS